jgi:FkbM family methyltransferase
MSLKANLIYMMVFTMTITLLYVLKFENFTGINAPSQDIVESNIVQFDLKQSLEPAGVYDPIECKKSKAVLNTSIIYCVHERINGWISDYTSRLLLKTGIREEEIVAIYLKYLKVHEDWFVIDIGAHLGLYTLFGASIGRKVLAVEPFYNSYIRLHKAAVKAGTWGNITLVINAVSDKPNEIKYLQKHTNIGQQSILHGKTYDAKFKNSLSPDKAKHYVPTIVLDDLVNVLPLNDNQKRFKRAIMKIDCEAHEPYVFQRASKLFDQIQFCMIFMEWGNLIKKNYPNNEREQMLGFLYARDFKAHDTAEKPLERENYKKWPIDVIWKNLNC